MRCTNHLSRMLMRNKKRNTVDVEQQYPVLSSIQIRNLNTSCHYRQDTQRSKLYILFRYKHDQMQFHCKIHHIHKNVLVLVINCHSTFCVCIFSLSNGSGLGNSSTATEQLFCSQTQDSWRSRQQKYKSHAEPWQDSPLSSSLPLSITPSPSLLGD